MVLYFSATGNTEFVARQLARRLGDQALNLRDRIRSQDYGPIRSDKPFVICSPVYVCEMPRFLSAYLKKASLGGNRKVYFVFTSGGYAGSSSVLARNIVRRKRMTYMGSAELVMPRNYIADSHYPELTREEIEDRIRDSLPRIVSIAKTIKAGRKLRSRHVWLAELLITLPFNPVWCHLKQGVRGFYVTDACIACGKCIRGCPLNVIRPDRDGKPVWTGRSCAHCMACIQNCPVEAIEYKQETQHKQRYRFDKYRYVISEGKDRKKARDRNQQRDEESREG